MPRHDTSSLSCVTPTLPGSTLVEILRRRAVARENNTSAETYGGPQTPAEPLQFSTASLSAKPGILDSGASPCAREIPPRSLQIARKSQTPAMPDRRYRVL